MKRLLAWLLALIPQETRDDVYLTRARAIELGATHEGFVYGVPVWFWIRGGDPDRNDPDDADATQLAAKFGLCEHLITLFNAMHAFVNSFRDVGDEEPFALLMRPIRRDEVSA